ncbi:MAG: winged helix DNA-binding protein [Sulfuritalea sp.]|nr:winged helix DNA-binding protein [Sulfuritalea sp.]
MRLERSSMVPMLDKLSRRGLLGRRASTTDQRLNHLHLTDAGRELLAGGGPPRLPARKGRCKPFYDCRKKLLLELLGRFSRVEKSRSAWARSGRAASRRDTGRRSQRLPSSW